MAEAVQAQRESSSRAMSLPRSSAMTAPLGKSASTLSTPNSKRKRSLPETDRASPKDGPSPDWKEQAQRDYYQRLVHQCHKDLNQQFKRVKNFSCQKLVRKIKAESTDNSTAVEQLKFLRSLHSTSWEPWIQECFRRLGLLQLRPVSLNASLDSSMNPAASKKSEEEKKYTDNKASGPPHTTDPSASKNKVWMERFLQHPRLRQALEEWNDQVTAYRRWCLRLQEGGGGGGGGKARPPKDRPTLRPSRATAAKRQAQEVVGHSQFTRLGQQETDNLEQSDQADDDNDDDDSKDPDGRHGKGDNAPPDGYGPASTTKKNRPGQRARRAKVMALEASRQGRSVETSYNWRPKADGKSKRDRPSAGSDAHHSKSSSRLDHHPEDRTPGPPSSTATQPTEPSSSELHPSWQARKAQKNTIVEFKGKRITFE